MDTLLTLLAAAGVQLLHGRAGRGRRHAQLPVAPRSTTRSTCGSSSACGRRRSSRSGSRRWASWTNETGCSPARGRVLQLASHFTTEGAVRCRPEPKSRDQGRQLGLTALAVVGLALAACPGPRHTEQPPSAEAPAAQPAAPAAADSGVALEGTEWSLVALGGQPVAANEDRARPGLTRGRRPKAPGLGGLQSDDGLLRARRGVAQVRADRQHQDGVPGDETETRFLSALGATTRYEVAGSNLTLFGGDAPLARLEVVNSSGPAGP